MLDFPHAVPWCLWMGEFPTMENFKSSFTRLAEFPWDVLQYLSNLENSFDTVPQQCAHGSGAPDHPSPLGFVLVLNIQVQVLGNTSVLLCWGREGGRDTAVRVRKGDPRQLHLWKIA